MGKIVLSLVLPAHNEAARLPKAVRAAEAVLHGIPHEILIAEDGSSDGTVTVARQLATRNRHVRMFSFKERLGRGRAVGRAFVRARGVYVGFMDADLATDPRALLAAIAALRENDVVVGSRYAQGSVASRTPGRQVASRSFNALVRYALGSQVRDHQCGFKFFRRSVALKLCKEARATHWFWDTEILVLAQRQGMRVKEIPVRWAEKPQGSKVSVFRDSVKMARDVLELRRRLR